VTHAARARPQRATRVATPTTNDARDARAFRAAFARVDGDAMASERRAVKASRLVGCGVVFQGGGASAIDSKKLSG